MASIINASSTGSGGIVQTADASGVLQLQSNGTLALNVDTSANISVGTTTANTIAGNSNARYFAVQGDGTLSSADGRIVLSNPRAYANISAGSTTAGRVYFQLINGSGGTTAEAANIDALASGSGGASGYGLDIRFLPKADNGSSSEAARIKSGGTFILAGGSTSATGTGITFPATQSASSDANTLDDYEEGTFTPTFLVNGLTTNVTQLNQFAQYIKVGKLVFVNLVVGAGYNGASTAPVTISGFPFTNGAGYDANMAVAYSSGTWTQTPRGGYMGTGTATLQLTTSNNASYITGYLNAAVQGTAMGTGGYIQFSFCYQASS